MPLPQAPCRSRPERRQKCSHGTGQQGSAVLHPSSSGQHVRSTFSPGGKPVPAERTFSTRNHTILWFGASISIAEILTGTLLAPLGLTTGLTAILLGHAIGGFVLLLAGLVGARSGLSATASFRISFGRYGSYFFTVLNMLQLLGWTAVMIICGAQTLNAIAGVVLSWQNEAVWVVAIGGLIFIWISRGLMAIFRLHTLVVVALFACLMALAWKIVTAPAQPLPPSDGLSFGAAVELNVTMCLSWLPLISDYTRTLRQPVRGTVCGVCGYIFGGMLMFSLGLGAAIQTRCADISSMLLTAGLGTVGLFIVAFSTLTNTFLDAHSSGISALNINPRLNARTVGRLVCVLGSLVALFVPMSQYENFLYFIGSVFAPLFAILLVDFFIFGRRDVSASCNVRNMLLWLVGFMGYRLLLSHSMVLGTTFPIMCGIGLLCVLVNLLLRRHQQR